MRNFMIPVVAFTMLAGGPAHAGLIFKQVQSSEDSDGHRTRTVTEMRIEGAKARIDLVEMADNPFLKPGAYMLLLDADTIYVVNPGDRTYSRMDLEEMRNMNALGAQADEQMRQHGTSVSVEELKIDKKLEEPGPTMLGLPTQHVLYEVSYSRPMGIQTGPIKMSIKSHETYEIWATRALEPQMAAAAALRKQGGGIGPSAGSPTLPQIGETLSRHGLPLKTIETSESKMSLPMAVSLFGAKTSRSKTTVEITELREELLGPELFQLPRGYAEVDMTNPNAAGMPDLNQIPAGQEPSGGASMPPMPDLGNMPR
jgi:hypothetical protein